MARYKKAIQNIASAVFPRMGMDEVKKYEEKGKTFEEFRSKLREINKNKKR